MVSGAVSESVSESDAPKAFKWVVSYGREETYRALTVHAMSKFTLIQLRYTHNHTPGLWLKVGMWKSFQVTDFSCTNTHIHTHTHTFVHFLAFCFVTLFYLCSFSLPGLIFLIPAHS